MGTALRVCSETTGLLGEALRLLSAEAQVRVSELRGALMLVAAATGTLMLSLVAAGAAVVAALLTVMPLWSAALVVAAAALALAVGLGALAAARLKGLARPPEHTLNALEGRRARSARGAPGSANLGAMRIATWNVNSLRARLDRVLSWLDRARPDVLLMQETKLADADAPTLAFRQAGYELAHHGEGRWNGVAIACRVRHRRAWSRTSASLCVPRARRTSGTTSRWPRRA